MNAREAFFAPLPPSDTIERSSQLNVLKNRLRQLAYSSEDATIERFEHNAAVAGIVIRHSSFSRAGEFLLEYVRDKKSIVLSDDDLIRTLNVAHSLQTSYPGKLILSAVRPPEGDVRKFNGVGVGVTMALAGIAETGSVITAVSSDENRSVSLLPDEHVVFLPVERIMPSLETALPLLETLVQDGKKSAVTLIGGPSKTADIEKVLVTGVHGPETLTIVLLDAP